MSWLGWGSQERTPGGQAMAGGGRDRDGSGLPEPPATARYLRSPVNASGLVFLLIAALLYQHLSNPADASRHVAYPLLLAVLAIWARASRWVLQAILAGALVVHVYLHTQVVSLDPAYQASTRDRAVEMTTQALLRGENPWNHVPALGARASTGPTSILVALPAVLLLGRINWLSFAFWISFFGILLAWDIRRRNDTFPTLSLLFLLGLFGFAHTLRHRLDELYYPYLYLVAAYAFVRRGRNGLAGACLALTILSRLNYVFVVLAFLLWYGTSERFRWRALLRVAGGMLVASVFVVLPFAIVGGTDFLTHNPFLLAYRRSGIQSWPETNAIFHLLNEMGRLLGQNGMRVAKLLLVGFVLLMTTWRLRGVSPHPFWHMAVAAFSAHTLVLFTLPLDYAVIFVLPAFLGIALTTAVAETSPGNLDAAK